MYRETLLRRMRQPGAIRHFPFMHNENNNNPLDRTAAEGTTELETKCGQERNGSERSVTLFYGMDPVPLVVGRLCRRLP